MDIDNNKKLFIIQSPKYGKQFEAYFGLLCDQIEDHFKRILKHLKIYTYKNYSVEIKLNIDASKPKKIRAYAERLSTDPYIYNIKINAGLSYRLWTVSRTFSIPNYNILPWIEECIINDERLRNKTKKDIIADYAFFINCYYILLHEISHVVLGHLDYLNDKMNINHVDEFQPEEKDHPSKELKIRKAFESEADRQAGEWLIAFFENSLGNDGLGGYLLFPSRKHAYEFYVYAIMSVFRLMQDLTQGEGIIHPKPNERLYILIGCLSKYFKQNSPQEHDEIFLHALKSCLEAGKKFFVIDSFEPIAIMKNAHNLAFVDDVIKEINIRDFQHKFELVNFAK